MRLYCATAVLLGLAQTAIAQTSNTSTITQTDAKSAVSRLCSQMPYMAGCSVATFCTSNPSSSICNQVSILADICAFDMPKMKDCSLYTSSCTVTGSNSMLSFSTNSSAVCQQNPPIKMLPLTNTINSQIKSICTEMDMEGCSKCKINPQVSSTYFDCDQLEIYSGLCQAMPDMSQCSDYKQMCSNNPGLAYCSESSTMSGPAMKMYFHAGLSEYVLFQSIVPKTQAHYSLACLVLFVLAIIYEGLLALHSIFELKWVQKDKAAACFPAKFTAKPSRLANGLSVAFGRASFKFVNATIGYSLMLVTMTFNVGLFFAVISGLAAGTFLFGGYIRKAQIESGMEEESPTGCCD